MTSDQETFLRLKNEIFINKQLRHRNICKLFEPIESEKYYLMVLELCSGGDLLHYVRRRRFLNENVAKVLFVQLVTAVQYIHDKNIIHRDIKLENILLDNLGVVKLCDFGVSRLLDNEDEGPIECCGTPAYMAPEVILAGDPDFNKKEKNKKKKLIPTVPKAYGKECDIWSMGVVLYTMLYGQLPFRGNTIRETKDRVLNATIALKSTVSETAQ